MLLLYKYVWIHKVGRHFWLVKIRTFEITSWLVTILAETKSLGSVKNENEFILKNMVYQTNVKRVRVQLITRNVYWISEKAFLQRTESYLMWEESSFKSDTRKRVYTVVFKEITTRDAVKRYCRVCRRLWRTSSSQTHARIRLRPTSENGFDLTPFQRTRRWTWIARTECDCKELPKWSFRPASCVRKS